jgi:hypothetical protein
VVVVEHSGFSLGCYTSLEFREIFRLNFFKDQTGPLQYLCAGFYYNNMLYMSFSGGAFII